MGIPSAPEPRFHSAVPDTPPEILTPDSASFPSRQPEERPWTPRAPPSPPMSNYDPAIKSIDMSSSSSHNKGSQEPLIREEPASQHSAPRQQLPSLSSIFGPPSQMHQFPSAFSDRPGPYHPRSPLDHPLRPAVGSSSYFPPPTSSAAQHRNPLDARFQDRPQIPSLSQFFPGPLSPLPRQEQKEGMRMEYGSGNQWSMQHDTGREYSLASCEPTYQSPVDRYSLHLPGTTRDENRRMDSREQVAPQNPAYNPPATPTSSLGSEVPPTKDGLGPKIWTGTHFLPRFVRAAEVPGEGMCYFYDDGSHCKTVIDGEAVNAHWGVTKAGKPRKRLAIACVTCREKKIKCDPDYPRCVQCEKFGRVCKFKNAPRGGGHNTSPSTPSIEPEDARRLGRVMRPATDFTRPSSHSSESVSPRTIRPASPEFGPSVPRKQARVDYEHYSPTTGRSSLIAPITDQAGQVFSWRLPETLPRIHEDVLRRPWQRDPDVS